MKPLLAFTSLLLLGACANYSGSGLQPGQAGVDDVLRVMGPPAQRWQDRDGSQQLAYPRGPSGFHTYMAYIGPDGKLQRLENVLDSTNFTHIQPGMSKNQVLRLLGPPQPGWTAYFPARDELAWEWRYCDQWNEAARFNVLFDASKGTVRSTLSQTEAVLGLCGEGSCICSR
jgi:hypothetical protein